jgi:hypothetical protein
MRLFIKSVSTYIYTLNSIMRILNLILYSDENGKAAHYAMMRDALRPYLQILARNTRDEFEYYFYHYDQSLPHGVHAFHGDTITIGGTESFLPGILEKTIKALQICRAKTYDYVVRSNVSTVVDFMRLRTKMIELSSIKPIEWCGAVLHLTWNDPASGINDNKFHGLRFVSGSCIIMARETVEKLLDNADQIDYSVIDDVSMAATLTKLGFVPTDISAYWNMFDRREREGIIMYRNRSSDRWLDAANVARTAQQLIDSVAIVRLASPITIVDNTRNSDLPAIFSEKTATVDQLYAAGEDMRHKCRFALSYALGLAAHALYNEPSTSGHKTALWQINDLIAVSGYYVPSRTRAAQAARDGLADPTLPPFHRDRFKANLEFCEK